MNNKIIRYIFMSMLILLPFAATGKQNKVVKILTIGNSFSQDAVEQNLHELAANDGITLVIGNAYIGGCSLKRHLDNSKTDKPAYEYRKILASGIKTNTKKVTLKEIILDEKWDYISFQQASSESGIYSTFQEFLPPLMEYVRTLVGDGPEFILHQTWAYAKDSKHNGFKNYNQDQMLMYNSIVQAYKDAAKDYGFKIVIPSGTAIQNVRTSSAGDDITRDGYHLDLTIGRYTAACTWYEKLLGKKVAGNSFKPKELSPAWQKIAQEAAHKAVKSPHKVSKINL